MKILYVSWAVFFILLCILPTSQSFSQYDPGEPDTVRFGEVIVEVSGPPYQGTAFVPLVVFNDEAVSGMNIPLIWTGPLSCDSGKFVGERVEYLTVKGVLIYNGEKRLEGVAWSGSAIPPFYIPPGDGDFVHLYFSVLDTGYVTIDTTTLPWQQFCFLDTFAHEYYPQFLPTEFHILPYLPGDVNGDAVVEIGDVIFLINYLYRNGPPPDFPEQGDVNGDCQIDLGDVVYLINYLYKGGPAPLIGCTH